jgi:hypothetical protein
MAHDVFISHARKDKSIADAICSTLESGGLSCWIAARDIPPGRDWTEAIRNAIESGRVMVLVLSENANVAPHIEREIAHAFYTRRIIIPFRLAHTLPRRDFLFYLGNVPWFNAVGQPGEQDLEALTARIKSLVAGETAARNGATSHDATKATTTLRLNPSIGALRTPHYSKHKILKRVATAASLLAVVCLLWVALRQTKEEGNGQSTYFGQSATPALSPHATSDSLASLPTYAFTRFGLWEPANAGPKPLVQQEAQATPTVTPVDQSPHVDQKAADETEMLAIQKNLDVRPGQEVLTREAKLREGHMGKSRPKGHKGRVRATDGLKLTDIKRRLMAFWHEIVGRRK